MLIVNSPLAETGHSQSITDAVKSLTNVVNTFPKQ